MRWTPGSHKERGVRYSGVTFCDDEPRFVTFGCLPKTTRFLSGFATYTMLLAAVFLALCLS
jgi:hypothetical protein